MLSVQWQLPNSISSSFFLSLPKQVSHKCFKLIMYKTVLSPSSIPFFCSVAHFNEWWHYSQRCWNQDIWKMVAFFILISTAHQLSRPFNSTSFISHKFICFSPFPLPQSKISLPTRPLHIEYWPLPREFIFPVLLGINLTVFSLIFKNKTKTKVWILSSDLKDLSNLSPAYLQP